MRLLCLTAACLLLASAACGGDSAAETPADAVSEAEQLGREIGGTYLTLLDDVQAMLALNLTAEQLRPALRLLKEDYRVRFANLGCLREELDTPDRDEVDRTAADFIDEAGPLDADWFRQAVGRYGSDAEIRALLADVQSLHVYASFEVLRQQKPGETVVCSG